MLTLLSERPEEIQRFLASPWKFQQTFKTPLGDLERFVSTLLGPFEFQTATLSAEEVVFEPKNLLHLLANNSLFLEDKYQFSIRATGKQAIVDLLQAALGDWVDFFLIPFPETIVISADHDEYTTFYTTDAARLRNLASGLENSGFQAVSGYTRDT